jgi:hypothetical protein
MTSGPVVAKSLLLAAIAASLSLVACSRRTAERVCAELEQGKVARNCREDDASSETQDVVRFDLASGSGSHGMVYVFGTEENYRKAVQGFDESIREVLGPMHQEPHLFRNEQGRLIIMLVHGADERAQRVAAEVAAGS